MDHFAKIFEKQNNAGEVEELCWRMGAAFVIDTARAFVERRERLAAQEHARRRDESLGEPTPKAVGST